MTATEPKPLEYFKEKITAITDEGFVIVGVGEIDGEDTFVFASEKTAQKAFSFFRNDIPGNWYSRKEIKEIKKDYPVHIYWITHTKYGKRPEDVKPKLGREAIYEILSMPNGITRVGLSQKFNRSMDVIRDIRMGKTYQPFYNDFLK